MSSFGFRPHFSQELDLDPVEVQRQIEDKVRDGEFSCEMKSFPGYVCLRIPAKERRYWSPRLNISIDAKEGGGTHVQGVYGPNANFWSTFLYGYLLTGSVGLFSGILGAIQWKIGHNAWGLWVFGGALAVAIGLYLAAQFGQKLAVDQTYRLHQIYESVMGRTGELH
jgi:hypothetical protein